MPGEFMPCGGEHAEGSTQTAYLRTLCTFLPAVFLSLLPVSLAGGPMWTQKPSWVESNVGSCPAAWVLEVLHCACFVFLDASA